MEGLGAWLPCACTQRGWEQAGGSGAARARQHLSWHCTCAQPLARWQQHTPPPPRAPPCPPDRMGAAMAEPASMAMNRNARTLLAAMVPRASWAFKRVGAVLRAGGGAADLSGTKCAATCSHAQSRAAGGA